ncbi:MAG: hypothetical protein H0V17_07855, partial [Deltaproteobacteria bacterium]|nr:hypothetical protein [Deltaproteobacteria bacterium]
FATVRALGSALADAVAPKRPWAQDQIGALVLEMFADETAARRAAVAQAIANDGAALHGPPIASNSAENEDDEQGFPSVETEAGPISGDIQTVVERMALRAATGVSLPPGGQPIAAPEIGTAPPRQSRVWMYIALVLVVLAGGGVALAFVMQQQPPERQDPIILEQADAATRDKDMKTVLRHTGELASCTSKYRVSVEAATVDMMIDSAGKLESVRFEPAEIDSGPLGGCLRTALGKIAFVKRNASTGLHLDLSLPPRKS